MSNMSSAKAKGFTLIELVVVIAVIGILTSIALVTYAKIQAQSRDEQRKSDVVLITKALEQYYSHNGEYPAGGGSSHINGSWSTSEEPASWQNLAAKLKPYLTQLPVDPTNTSTSSVINGSAYNYAYYAAIGGYYCGTTVTNQVFILVYRFESAPQEDNFQGDCSTNRLGPYSGSNYRVRK